MNEKYYLWIFIIFLISSCRPDYEFKNNRVYYKYLSVATGEWEERMLKGADCKSFSTIDSEKYKYGKDKNNVYFKNEVIPGADPASFKLIEKGYAIDNKRAYYYNDSIENSSSKEFQVIDRYYSKDYKDVYYEDKPMYVCSVEKFKLLYKEESKADRWATDGCSYFKKTFKVPTTDYENLITYKNYDVSKDKYFVYYLDKKIKILYEEKWGKQIDTIDIESFKVLGHNHYRDKHGCINIYGRVYHGRMSCK